MRSKATKFILLLQEGYNVLDWSGKCTMKYHYCICVRWSAGKLPPSRLRRSRRLCLPTRCGTSRRSSGHVACSEGGSKMQHLWSRLSLLLALDVYKRQVLACSRSSARWRCSLVSTCWAGRLRRPYGQLLVRRSPQCRKATRPFPACCRWEQLMFFC